MCFEYLESKIKQIKWMKVAVRDLLTEREQVKGEEEEKTKLSRL